MVKEPQTKEFYDFGAFRMDVKKHRLWRGEELIALTPKEFELLLILVEHAGRVVEKDDLHEKIWKDTFVEDGTLTRNISWLRKKLDAGNEKGEKIIETVPKRGYRFLPEVTKSTDENTLVIEEQTLTRIRIEETLTLPDAENSASRNTRTRGHADTERQIAALPNISASPRRRVFASLLLALGVLAIAAIAFAGYQIYSRRAQTKDSIAVRIVPFSGALGRENYPAFSPDGKQLAFAWNGGEAENLDIYVRLTNAGEPLRLTDTEFAEQHPTFSPDGSHIAFVRSLKTHGEVIIVPALGGAERRITKLFSGFGSVSFAPDGETLAVIDTEDSIADKNYGVYLINVKTGERRRLNAPSEYTGETTPRFSRLGKSVAFVRVAADNTQDLFIAPITGEAPRQITFDRKTIHSLAWSADGKEIFFVSFRGTNQPNIWRVAEIGGEPELVATGIGKDITNLAVSPDGKTVAFVENTLNMDIWRTEKNRSEKKFIGSTYNEFSPELSPDGSRLIFGSNRTGKPEIWMSDATGKNLRQITGSEAVTAAPHFSPDGANIVYYAKTNGNADIFSISTDGGTARRLTFDATAETSPVWSADGTSIYFMSNRTGENQIWKMPATGGEPFQITRRGVFYIIAALPAGDGILFLKTNDAAVWRVSTSGNGNEQIITELTTANMFGGNWSATPHGLYFLTQDSNKSFKIKFYDFAGGKITDAAENKLPENFYGGITASADGSIFIYARQDQNTGSIMLAELGK